MLNLVAAFRPAGLTPNSTHCPLLERMATHSAYCFFIINCFLRPA